jgi:hypothetical protein
LPRSPRSLVWTACDPRRLSMNHAPSAFTAWGANYHRACHHPATVGAPRVSHPLRALTAPRASRACFIPDPPVGFRPTGPFPFAEPQRLSAPVAFLAFAGGPPRPAHHRMARPRLPHHPVTRALPHGKPSARGANPG